MKVGGDATVSGLEGTSATGMSSETVLFDATWRDGSERFVARVAPDPADVTVFPSYDLERQFRLLQLVTELTSVPVPTVHWYEPDPSVIGSPFFVMSRVDGQVPPDVMPYNFGDNWLHDAATGDQNRLVAATVEIIAELHRAPVDRFTFLELDEPGQTPLRRHVAHTRAWYDWTAADGLRSPLIERAFECLERQWPDEGQTVVCWGDARIGNVLYRDFTPVGVLDWEMAALGPRELDVAWMIYAHEIFEHLAANFGLEGMPGFMKRNLVTKIYENQTGVTLEDLDFYRVYSAIQYAIVFIRTGARSVHFGEREMPQDVEELLYNRAQLEEMIA
jgi:aminoglycoside phosphotransferase (APT) family kinase protein